MPFRSVTCHIFVEWSGPTPSDFWWSGRIDLECSSKIFITLYQTIRCPNQVRIMNPHECEHLLSCTKEHHNIWIDNFLEKAKLDHHQSTRKFPSIIAVVKIWNTIWKRAKIYKRVYIYTYISPSNFTRSKFGSRWS